MCPNCKRKMQEIISKDKTILICKCGYKENKESFISKLADKKGEMNKKSLDNYVINNLSFKLNDYVVGLINSENDTILCCSYNDYDNTAHKNESFIDYKKMILHECVHILHTYYMAKDNSYFYKYLWEGIANYLTNQYEECNIENIKVEDVLNEKVSYRVYFSIIKRIIETYGLEKLKEILKFDKDSINILKEII